MAGMGRQSDTMIVSHSSKWKAFKEGKPQKSEEKPKGSQSQTQNSSQNSVPAVVRTVEGGFKSLDDDYTYVRGRGRGRYVCNSCGIRCKKPSMLKKHIRTHSNFRPYICKYCNFAFKTKGNLTKHMKSKTHHKKCVELGISPIPTTVPDDYNTATEEAGVPGPSDPGKPVAGDSDSEDEDMDEDEEDDEQFEDAMEDDDIEIIGEDNGMVAKGLVPFKPRLSTYPYNAEGLKKEGSDKTSEASSPTSEPLFKGSSSTVSLTTTSSLQPISSQAPVIGEKYYFSKTPIPNDVAKAAAETVMAIASSALVNATKSASVAVSNASLVMVSASASPIGQESHPPPSIANQSAQDILSPVTKSATVLSFIDKTTSKVPNVKILSPAEMTSSVALVGNGSRNKEVEQQPPPAELQAYLQAKAAMKAAAATTQMHHQRTHSVEEISSKHGSKQPHRIGSLTIERAPPITVSANINNHNNLEHLPQGPRNVTMNVMDMPSSTNLNPGKPLIHLPQDVQLISVSQIQKEKQQQQMTSPVKKSADMLAASSASMMTSPPNKTLDQAIKAENNMEQLQKQQSSQQSSTSGSSGSSSSTSGSSSSGSGKYVCSVCKTNFPNNAVLNIHSKIHYFERPYRCDACAVSFRTHGHLQKHNRSSGHFNKVNINATFGEPSTSNPRPFYCGDCKIGFRIHGHLAKHLRSKSHIMKLENSGKLPIGMFAEMERLGTNLNEIDTSDCETSLASLKAMASKLCKNKEITVDASNTNGFLSPPHNKEDSMDIKEEDDGRRSQDPPGPPLDERILYRKSPDQYPSGVRTLPPPPPSMVNGLTNHVALNLSIPPGASSSIANEKLDRRASFSSSGQDEPSTDSEAVRFVLSLFIMFSKTII